MTTTTESTESIVQAAIARVSAIEGELADLHAMADRMAFDELSGDPHAAARAIDLEAIIATKERERDRLKAAIEEGGKRIGAEQETRRVEEREATEVERDRLLRTRDEHFGRIEKAVAMLVEAFDDAMAADNQLAQAKRRLGQNHNFAGPPVGMYIGVKLMKAQIPVGLPPPPFEIERLGEPLSESGRAKAQAGEKRRRVAAQEAKGEMG